MIPRDIPDHLLLPSLARLEPSPTPRIPLPADGAGAKGIYGALTNGQRISLYLAPPVKAGLVGLAGALMREGSLDPCHRQMIIVRVAYLSGCAYELFQHRSMARRVGVSEAKLDALAHIHPPGLDEREQAIIAFVDELVNDVRPADATLSRMLDLFLTSVVQEAIIVTGVWMMLARMLETAGVELDKSPIGESSV